MNKAARSAVIGVIVVVGLLAAACGGSDEDTAGTTTTEAPDAPSTAGAAGPPDAEGPPQRGGKIVFGLEAEVDNLDPTKGAFPGSGHYVATALYDPLATVDAEGNAVPFLATAIEPNEDASAWTITLPEGVTFHDGAPLNAEAVKANIDAQLASLIASMFVTSIESAEVVSEYEVKVNSSLPWASFPYTLTTQVGYVASPATLADPAAGAPGGGAVAGTGPFVYKSWSVNESLVATANGDYWRMGEDDKPLPYVDEIEFRPIPDSSERFTDLRNGDLNVMLTYQTTDIIKLREDDWKRVEENQSEEDVVALNTSKPPFDQLVARQAIAYATDQEGRLEGTGQNVWEIATSPFAPGQLGYVEDDGWPGFDPDKAKELVQQYEAEHGPFEFAYQGATSIDDIGEQNDLVQGWRDAGMDVSIVTVDQPTLIANTVIGNYQATDWRNFGHLDPDADFMWWHSSTVDPGALSANVAQYPDPEIDAALEQARASDDPEVRQEAYATVARELNAGLPYVWLDRVVWVLAAAPNVNGIYAAANGTVATLGTKTWLSELWLST